MDRERRRVVRLSGLALAGGLAGCLRLSDEEVPEEAGAEATESRTSVSREVTPTPTPTPDAAESLLSASGAEWIAGTDYDGVADRRGADEVTVTVAAEGNGGNLAFAPAVLRIDAGTTVVWEWTGEGGAHNVVDEGGAFESGDAVAEAGHTYEHTFEQSGEYRYYCAPHQALGMHGVVVVEGDDGATDAGSPSDATTEHRTGAGAETEVNPDYGDWFDGVDNFDGTTVDRTGEATVPVVVGAQGNGGAFAFAPAALRVDQGATVRWEWTGEGGAHNVVARDETFDSGDAVAEAGTTFEYTFEDRGVYRYSCRPHQALGMRGAVVVG